MHNAANPEHDNICAMGYQFIGFILIYLKKIKISFLWTLSFFCNLNMQPLHQICLEKKKK